ncbi:MAG: hypothetical protein KDA85_03195, partial [Planctomycetaceae bacterium]|nr:hypothetical protein [Planctomycetaceae bacterium]
MNPTSSLRRRTFLMATAAASCGLPRLLRGALPDEGAITWHDVRDWGVEGCGFDDTEKYFDRLPGRAKGVVREAVWNLSRHSSGMLVRFRSDASSIHADYAVTSSNLAMPHMPATGV